MGRGAHGHSHKDHGHKHAHGHSHGNDHGHSHDDSESKFCGCCHLSNRILLICMLVMTFSFFLVELIVGQMTKSISLTTDSFHMLSDALALVIGLLSVIIAERKTNKNTFGWVRAEILGGLINSVFLVSLCIGIFIEAIERLIETREIERPHLVLLVGAIGLSINLIGLFIFGHAHSHSLPSVTDEDDVSDDENRNFITENRQNEKKKKNKCHILSDEANMNMKAVFLHVLADALGSIIVIISALLNINQKKLNIPSYVINYIDPALSLTLVLLIMSSTIPLLRDSALILLQTVPKEIQLNQLKDEIEKKIHGVESVHELHVWKLSGNKIIATAHIKCKNSVEYMKVASDLKKLFHKNGIHSTTIQPEFMEDDNDQKNCYLECQVNCTPHTCCGSQTKTDKTCNNNAQQVIDLPDTTS